MKSKLSRFNYAVFRAYKNAKEQDTKKLDMSFIRNMENATDEELRKLIYELNEIDYETEYIPKNISKYRLIQMLIDKYERLYEVINEDLKKI